MNKILSLCLLFLVLNFSSLEAECRLGMLISVTGDYASGGEECLLGHEVAEARYKTKNIPTKFILEDTKAQASLGVSLFKKLVDIDHVQAIHVVRSPVGMAINPLSKKIGVPILGAVAHPKFIVENPYAYQVWPTAGEESGILARLIIKDGTKTIYSLATEDDWMLAYEDTLVKEYNKLSGKVLVRQRVEPTFVDFRTLILKIKQAQPEAVFLGLAPNQLGIFIKQFREAGMTQKIYTTFMVKYEDVLKTLSNVVLDGIAFSEGDVIKPNFISEYQKISKGREPSAIGYSCYLSSEVLFQACEQHLSTKKDFQSVLSGMSSIDTLDQSLAFKDQKVEFNVLAKEYQAGQLVVVDL